MLEYQLHQPLVDLLPHLGRPHRLERRRRNLERQIEGARVSRVDDGGVACEAARAREETGDVLDRFLRRREADALESPAGEVLERLEHVTGRRLQRIGLSATQKPIEDIACFLAGTRRPTSDT